MESEDPPRRGNPKLLLIGGGVALFVVLFALTVALGMIFALREDIAALENQARRSAKAAKAMQEEIAGLKEQAAAVAAKRHAEATPRAANIDAVDTASDCVIRPGSKNPMAGCVQLDQK